MALPAVQLPQRRKQMTYGKSARTAKTWSNMTSDAEEDDRPSASASSSMRSLAARATYPTQNAESKMNAPKPQPTQPKDLDVWAMPSAEDVSLAHAPRVRARKLVATSKPATPSRATEAKPQLASWEQSKGRPVSQRPTPLKKETNGLEPVAEDKIKYQLQEITSKRLDKLASKSTLDHLATEPSSAAARLQAKRNLSSVAVPSSTRERIAPVQHSKRAGEDVETAENILSPRKRLRRPREEHQDDKPAGKNPTDRRERSPAALDRPMADQGDVFEFTDSVSNGDLAAGSVARLKSRARTVKGRAEKRDGLSSIIQTSAPARLHSMLSPSARDEQAPHTISRDLSLDESPQQAETHAPKATAKSLDPADRPTEIDHSEPAAVTPKQIQIWNKLLPSDATAPSPSVVGLGGLTLNSTKRVAAKASMPALGKSKSDVGRRRPKLVDRLKAMAETSDDESQQHRPPTDGDVLMEEGTATTPAAHPPVEEQPQPQSQSQSQSTAPTKRGAPKITYAKSRSHLEDSFDHDLLFDLGNLSGKDPSTLRSPGRPAQTPHKSAWDMDDSDEGREPKTKQFRSIHELRANGDNVRFMNDISSLLDDIADHKISARSRRRTALMELAIRLAEKSFAQKFCRQGFEHQLVAECEGTPDEIADFALTAALVVLMANDVPDSIFARLREANVLQWLHRLLDAPANLAAMAKDRRKNMSKSAQGLFVEFAAKVAKLDLIWGSSLPASISPRVVALKAYDLLISKLRRSGETSQLVPANSMRAIVPSFEAIERLPAGEPVSPDLALAISVLEGLTTPATASDWESDLVQRVSTLLVSSSVFTHPSSRHTYFLLLRLSHSLVNDCNANRDIFTTEPVISHLLHAVHIGFTNPALLTATTSTNSPDQAPASLHLDILVLELGMLILFAEQSSTACAYAALPPGNYSTLAALGRIFHDGRTHVEEAETEAAGAANVAHGYLAIALATLCRNADVRNILAPTGPRGAPFEPLVVAVEEFVMYHQKVDMANLEFTMDAGADGEKEVEVWGAFTEILKGVLRRLKEVLAE